jgi:hypothetical protein
MTLPLQPNLLGLPLAPAQCVVDLFQEQKVKELAIGVIDSNCFDDVTILPHFVTEYRAWIQSSVLNNVHGLDQFLIANFSAGTTESFDKFYLKHPSRRFRIFRGEYLYHRLSWKNQQHAWAYLDDEPLATNDAVIVSLPFADTGNCHPEYHTDFLDQCAKLDIPVLIDCAFFGVCAGINFDFAHPAIKEICFSHSKAFPVSTARIGIRFSRADDQDSLAVYNQTQYINRFAAALGLRLMQNQSPDTVFTKYRAQQLSWCDEYCLDASNTVIFGLDTKQNYPQYNRGSLNSNRLCFSKYFNTGKLPL